MSVSMGSILNFFEQSIDTTGWVRKEATMDGDGVCRVTVTYRDSEPKAYIIVSKDSFRSLDKASIYELAKSEVVSLLRQVGSLIDQTDRWMGGKCVAAIETPEARKGRSAFYRLWKTLAGGYERSVNS